MWTLTHNTHTHTFSLYLVTLFSFILACAHFVIETSFTQTAPFAFATISPLIISSKYMYSDIVMPMHVRVIQATGMQLLHDQSWKSRSLPDWWCSCYCHTSALMCFVGISILWMLLCWSDVRDRRKSDKNARDWCNTVITFLEWTYKGGMHVQQYNYTAWRSKIVWQ